MTCNYEIRIDSETSTAKLIGVAFATFVDKFLNIGVRLNLFCCECGESYFAIVIYHLQIFASDCVEGGIANWTNRPNESASDDDARKRDDGETLTLNANLLFCNYDL